MTTLAQPRPDVLEKDGTRIARQPDGRLLLICTVGHCYLDADDALLIAALARTIVKKESEHGR